MTPDHLSTTFAALADPTRRAILARLSTGEATVTELAEPFEMSMPAISKHLKVLERAGLVARSRDAQWRPCRLEAAPLKDVAEWVDDLPPHLGAAPGPARRLPARAAGEGEERMAASHARDRRRADTSDRELVFTRVFDAPRELVFRRGRTRTHLAHWWGPDGFTLTTSEMDVRPAACGASSCTAPTAGLQQPHRLHRSRIDQSAWSTSTAGEEGDEPVSFDVTVTFEEQDGKTHLTMQMVFPSKAELRARREDLRRRGRREADAGPAGGVCGGYCEAGAAELGFRPPCVDESWYLVPSCHRDCESTVRQTRNRPL